MIWCSRATAGLCASIGLRISPLPILEEVLRLASPENFWFDIEAKSAAGLTPDPRRYAQLLSEAIRRSAAQDSLAATGTANRILRSFDHEILRAFQRGRSRRFLSGRFDRLLERSTG